VKTKNPLVKLREANRMTCYNGYISELHRWKTKEQFVDDCVRYEKFRRTKPSQARIRRLAEEAWDWWFQA